jgi:hypothetical protein
LVTFIDYFKKGCEAVNLVRAVHEYVSEHGIEIFAQSISEHQDDEESEDDTCLLTWNPFHELQHGAN